MRAAHAEGEQRADVFIWLAAVCGNVARRPGTLEPRRSARPRQYPLARLFAHASSNAAPDGRLLPVGRFAELQFPSVTSTGWVSASKL